MPQYSYKAKGKNGEIKTGVLDAADEASLRKKLKESELALFSLKEAKKSKDIDIEFITKYLGVPQLEIITFVHLLTVMVKAGLSLSKSLDALSKQTTNARFAKVIGAINIDVAKGNSFADSLARHPDVFDDLFVNMVRVGELSGTLDTILELSAEQMRKDYDLKSRVKGAMMYPSVILLVMLAVGVVVMVYIIPKLTVIFISMNVELPASTKLLIGTSNLLTNHGLAMIGAVLVLGYLFRIFLRSNAGIKIFDKIILKLPIFGDISKKINIARFARTTSSLIKGGVSISTALKTVSKTLSNYYYKESIRIAAEKIEKGDTLKDILERTENLYSPLVLQMIEVGEETGSLDSILMDLAEFYEGEINETTKNLSTIIEPILMVMMGVAVGFFAISMIQPMYSIGDAI